MRIGIDVMGGDNAPDAILAGSLDALSLLSPEDTLVLIGDAAIIREGIIEAGLKNEPRIEVQATTQIITMQDPPVTALRPEDRQLHRTHGTPWWASSWRESALRNHHQRWQHRSVRRCRPNGNAPTHRCTSPRYRSHVSLHARPAGCLRRGCQP
ncbi:MAG: hypothetical protein HC898_05780 [Phycisphaerales bacterium]|nr:hypothetical protein [Phycisphaerales bacterium]